MSASRHILVADAHAATRQSTSQLLRDRGFRVSEATSGRDCLERAAGDVDLILLDPALTGPDGRAVCRELRAWTETRRIPIVHLSASGAGDADGAPGPDADADGHLAQPVEPRVLISTIEALLRARGAEDGMRRSEAKFRAVFDEAPCGIALLDSGFRLVDVNRALVAMLRMPREQMIGRVAGDFVIAAFRRGAEDFFAALAAGRPYSGVLSMRRGDGTEVQLEWLVSAHAAPGDHLAIVNDITDRLRLERERERLMLSERAARSEADRANHLKDEFMAMLAHELRNPLSAIVGWSNILKVQLQDKQQAEAVAGILRNADIQARMIADMLDVSRITSGKLQLDLDRINAREIVDDVLHSLRDTAAQKQIVIEARYSDEVGPLVADAVRFQQIVWNLVSNAVKFTNSGGRVEVFAAVEPACRLRIRVTDTGCGIAPEFLPHVFDRFKQHGSQVRRASGLGLGLTIVKQLVELHGGSITVSSPGVDRGTTFEVLLPRAGSDSTEWIAFGRDGGEATREDLRGLRILIVDDDADTRALIRLVLTEAGAEVEESASAELALKLIPRFFPDVLISDIGMAPMDGYDLIRAVRAKLTPSVLPAIALTAFMQREDRERSLQAGYQLHLGKPVDPRRLLSAVQDARNAARAAS